MRDLESSLGQDKTRSVVQLSVSLDFCCKGVVGLNRQPTPELGPAAAGRQSSSVAS